MIRIRSRLKENLKEKNIPSSGTMAKDDQIDCHINPCKRKLVESGEPSQEAVDNASKFKKAKHPWQIKGISIERNIISQEVRMNDEDPQQMVGVIKYEEKGTFSVNLSASKAHQDVKSAMNRSKISNVSTVSTHGNIEDDIIHPSTSSEGFNSNTVLETPDNTAIHAANRYLDTETMCTNDSHDATTEHCFEDESQSSMEHETSNASSLRERNVVADIFPTLNFQQCVWQKREMGCAIVDNVFNKTLEEMGLSPDPKVNKFATDRLQILQQGIDAAINQQGLFTQHPRYGQMEHSHSAVETDNTEEYKPGQDQLMKRRLSLEQVPNTKVTFKRRLSQPLTACRQVYKERLAMDDESAVDTNECIDDDSHTEITCEEELNDDKNKTDTTSTDESTASACMNSESEQMSSFPLGSQDGNLLVSTSQETDEVNEESDKCLIDLNETESSEKSPKYLPDSENLMDLAVSTAIKSQGLSL